MLKVKLKHRVWQYEFTTILYQTRKIYIFGKLRLLNATHRVFFVVYRQGKCAAQPVGINTSGRIPKMIAAGLKNPKEYAGYCFRRPSATILVDRGASVKASWELEIFCYGRRLI